MRCLGRLFLAFILILLLAAGWLYRQEIGRWVRGLTDPAAARARIGHPSPAAGASARQKVDSLLRFRPDSILLSADEMATLVAEGAGFLSASGLDSVSVELGNRSIRVRTLVHTDRLPQRLRDLSPIHPGAVEEVVAAGSLTPVRDGVAEWRLDHVLVRGLPIPSDLVARAIGKLTGRISDGRLEVALPPGITGFRVRPEGVVIYQERAR
jgi:hypothetical protein